MARWTRAADLLDLPAGSRVLDLGCAFGFGTRYLARQFHAFGHDLSAAYIRRARTLVPSALFTSGPADRVPHPDSFFDAVLLLDVLEHVPRQDDVVREIARVLRPGGTLVLSVPNKGALAWLDSLNLYHGLFGESQPPPTDDPSWSVSPLHRHYSYEDVRLLLEPHFVVQSVQYTGFGIAEAVNFVLLVLFRAWTPLPRVYAAAQYLYFSAYLLEDLIRTPSWGYHMMILAKRR